MSGDIKHQLPRLAIPGQTSVNVTHHPGTSIQHHPIVQQAPGALNVQLLGGLTKLEWMATQIYAAQRSEDMLVVDAVDLAERLLAECHRRQHGPPLSPEGNGEE